MGNVNITGQNSEATLVVAHKSKCCNEYEIPILNIAWIKKTLNLIEFSCKILISLLNLSFFEPMKNV